CPLDHISAGIIRLRGPADTVLLRYRFIVDPEARDLGLLAPGIVFHLQFCETAVERWLAQRIKCVQLSGVSLRILTGDDLRDAVPTRDALAVFVEITLVDFLSAIVVSIGDGRVSVGDAYRRAIHPEIGFCDDAIVIVEYLTNSRIAEGCQH